MEKGLTFAYEMGDNIYINLTNRCSNACTFCVRNGKDSYYGNKLWLQREPTCGEVLAAVPQKPYKEAVFCGFGEPTERVGVLVEVAAALKARGFKIRINTNGQGNLINGRDITADLAGVVDYVNVSMNAPSAEEYQAVCKSRFGERAFTAMLDFAALCAERGIKTVFSVVDCIGRQKVEECARIAAARNIPLRVHPRIYDS